MKVDFEMENRLNIQTGVVIINQQVNIAKDAKIQSELYIVENDRATQYLVTRAD